MHRTSRFVPWDEDADVDMSSEAWGRVKDILETEKETYQVPGPGCLLIDHDTFGARSWYDQGIVATCNVVQ